MPAILDDPDSPTIYRVSGNAPFPTPDNPELPPDMVPRQVTLRDRQTTATIVPFASKQQVPRSLAVYLCDQLNKEIEGGDTYPMTEPFTPDRFYDYWFQNFGAVMMLGNIESVHQVTQDEDWSKQCLGSFYIKPNYPGRSSHVCNAGFIVTDASRNRGVGRLMGEAYIEWAPRMGYTYSVFNLVYETNVASCKIWDALGFKRIGRVKGCGNLKSYPGQLIDAIIYGRDLSPGDSDDLVSEERFDKIKFYLKHNKYPNGADRAEKSRLRSAATHYKLLDDDKLMLKDKEVISDPIRQYDIARGVHVQQHAGINKTTATIADKFHWSRIKETVSDVIRNCPECKDLGKAPNPNGSRKGTAPAATSTSTTTLGVASLHDSGGGRAPLSRESSTTSAGVGMDSPAMSSAAGRVLALQDHHLLSTLSQPSSPSPGPYANPSDLSTVQTTTYPYSTLNTHSHHHHPHAYTTSHSHQDTLPEPNHPHGSDSNAQPSSYLSDADVHTQNHQRMSRQTYSHPRHPPNHNPMLQDLPAQHHHHHSHDTQQHAGHVYPPIDPQIIHNARTADGGSHSRGNTSHGRPVGLSDNDVAMASSSSHHGEDDIQFDQYPAHADDFQALFNATEVAEDAEDAVMQLSHDGGAASAAAAADTSNSNNDDVVTGVDDGSKEAAEKNDVDEMDQDLEMLIDQQEEEEEHHVEKVDRVGDGQLGYDDAARDAPQVLVTSGNVKTRGGEAEEPS